MSHAEERRLAAPSVVFQHSFLYCKVFTTARTLAEAGWQVTEHASGKFRRGILKDFSNCHLHCVFTLHCFSELFQNICRFAPVLLLPRYIVATRSISLRSQNGCTVLWNAHVNTKIASFWKISVGWTVTAVVISYLGTSSTPSSSEKLLPSDIASSVAHSGVGT